jgi:hypothetical protein
MKGGREVAGGAVVAEEEEAPDAGAMVCRGGMTGIAAGSGEATEVSSPAGVRLSWGRIQLTAFCE